MKTNSASLMAYLLLFVLVFATASAAMPAEGDSTSYLFTYFTGNGEDGLHLAWSRDGYQWEALNDGKSYLMPGEVVTRLQKTTASRVQIGYCARLSEIDAAKAAGFDYLELRTSEIAALSDADYEKLAEKLKQIGLPVPVTYLFIPGAIKLTGPNIDKEQQMTYVKKAFDRVAKLGVQIVTFGSGPARQVPEGFSKEEAFKQLVEFCQRIAPEARARSITVAIEPQRQQECNIINTLAETLELVEAVNDPNIRLMVDFYQMEWAKEDPAIILKVREHVRHVQIANPTDRGFPLREEEYNYGPFFEYLRKIGYDKRISVEALTKDFANDAPQAIAFLRRAYTR